MLDEDVDAYRRGVAAFRNARDLAQEFRDSFMQDAERRMNSLPREERERKIKEAVAKMEYIVDGSPPAVSSVAGAQSLLNSDSEGLASVDWGDAGEKRTSVSPVPRSRKDSST